MAQVFDPGTLTLSDTPIPIANEVGSYALATSGLWSVALNGTLLYRSGGSGLAQLTLRDSGGKTIRVVGEPNEYFTPALSPDGTRVAFPSSPGPPPPFTVVQNWMAGLTR
jgi:hypothetical protein